jgi:hypothetical protein
MPKKITDPQKEERKFVRIGRALINFLFIFIFQKL